MLKQKIAIYLCTLLGIGALYLCRGMPLDASDKIIAAGYYNNYPYEYLNNDGKPSGFTVELFDKIAETMDIDYELLLLPPERVADMQAKGEPDIIVGGVDSCIYKEYSFSGTALEFYFTFAVRKDSSISDFSDLKERRVAIAGHEVFSQPVSDIIRKLYGSETVYINNPVTAVVLLNSGGCDAVFMQNSRMKEILHKLQQDSIHELEVNPGRLRYGYFVRKEDEKLLNSIRTGLGRVYADGSYGKVYNRWFKTEDNKDRSNKKLVIIWFIVSAAVFILFIYINSCILKKRIDEKTVALNNTIADLKKTEAELLMNEKKFRKIFNKSPSGILILDPSGRVIHFNEAIKKIFGITNPDEILNLDIIESPNATEWFKARIKNYHSVSIEFKYDFELIRSTGFYDTSREGEIIIDASIFPFSIHGEDGLGYICHILDVTQNRTLLQHGNETARRYEVIFDSIRDGLWEWRLGDDTLRINRQFISMLGYRKEHLPLTFAGICELIHPGDREEAVNLISERIKGGRSFTAEYRLRKNDGEWIWIRSRGEVIEWDHELSPVTVIATHTDISQLKITETEKMEDFPMNRNHCKNDTLYRQAGSSTGRRVLIVDDNCLITLHLAELLTRLGFLCVNAMSGIEALEIVKNDSEFDVILLDLEMPELDGMTTMKLLKDIKNDIPVIANTGHCDSSCTDDLICSGFDDVVSKPVQELILLEKIEKLISSSSRQSSRNGTAC